MLDAFGTALLGSWTRINGAGMTCPDWPTCHGLFIPSFTGGTIWEWTHRFLAFLLIPLLIAVIAAAWRASFRPERQPAPEGAYVMPTAATIAGLFIVQVILGALTVHLANSPISVVLHWGAAMALIASLAAMSIFASPEDARPSTEDAAAAAVGQREAVSRRKHAVPLFLSLAAVAAFITMCMGAYVSSSGAGLACLSIPECAGNVIVYSQGQIVQMVHRVLAGLTLLASTAAFAIVWLRTTSARTRIATSLGLALVFVQILLGLLNVALRLPMDLREAHAANAALVFLAFIVASLFAVLDAQPAKRLAGRTVPIK